MQRFTKVAFERTDEDGKTALAADLAESLTERLKEALEFHQGVRELVDHLRALGHDLWSFDESDAMEVWCPNYQTPSGPGIVVTFTTEGVEVEWSEQVPRNYESPSPDHESPDRDRQTGEAAELHDSEVPGDHQG
jgi:hypothetical protein